MLVKRGLVGVLVPYQPQGLIRLQMLGRESEKWCHFRVSVSLSVKWEPSSIESWVWELLLDLRACWGRGLLGRFRGPSRWRGPLGLSLPPNSTNTATRDYPSGSGEVGGIPEPAPSFLFSPQTDAPHTTQLWLSRPWGASSMSWQTIPKL